MKRNNKWAAILLVIALVISLCITCAFASTETVTKNLSYN